MMLFIISNIAILILIYIKNNNKNLYFILSCTLST